MVDSKVAENGEEKPLIEGGCYIRRYVPIEPFPDILFFEGTARFMRFEPEGQVHSAPIDSSSTVIKGGADLYRRPGCTCDPKLPENRPEEWFKNDPTRKEAPVEEEGKAIPIFPRNLYRYYLQILSVIEDIPDGTVSLAISIHEFKEDVAWPNPGSRWVCMHKVTPTPSTGYREYLVGNLFDQDSGQIIGTLTMCRISTVLRRATVVIHKVNGVKFFPGYPEVGGKPVTQKDFDPKKIKKEDVERGWKAAFKEAGWAVTAALQERDLKTTDTDGEWTTGELQQALYVINLRRRLEGEGLLGLMEDAAGKNLEEMTPEEIQKHLPDLSAVPDPLDKDWVYQLLCVERIEGVDRGLMFDPYGSDSNNLPREGAAVAAEWEFGDDAKPLKVHPTLKQTEQANEIHRNWGTADLNQLQNVPDAYFRVGVHEIGHAMGLDHNFKDDGFMNTTDSIALDNAQELDEFNTAHRNFYEAFRLAEQTAPVAKIAKSKVISQADKNRQLLAQNAQEIIKGQIPELQLAVKNLRPVQKFPFLIRKQFHADDLDRLRFGPDVTVRPGTRYDDSGPLAADENSIPADGLELQATPLLRAIPFGAPARINVKIVNTSGQFQKAPISLSLKAGAINGSVVDPAGNDRKFWPLKKSEDSEPGQILAPYETKTYAMTLLRGPQKALFPMVGNHQVKIRAEWQRDGRTVFLETKTVVNVQAPVDDHHMAAALRILSTPDTLFSIAVVGDHLIEGNQAIKAAVANPILKPHFGVIQAKLFLIGPRDIKLEEACKLIDEKVVMSFEEIDSVTKLLDNKYKPETAAASAPLKRAVQNLDAKLHKLCAEGSIEGKQAHQVSLILKRLRGWIHK